MKDSRRPQFRGALSGLPGWAVDTTCSSRDRSRPCMASLPIFCTVPLAWDTSDGRHAGSRSCLTWHLCSSTQANRHPPQPSPCQGQATRRAADTPALSPLNVWGGRTRGRDEGREREVGTNDCSSSSEKDVSTASQISFIQPCLSSSSPPRLRHLKLWPSAS